MRLNQVTWRPLLVALAVTLVTVALRYLLLRPLFDFGAPLMPFVLAVMVAAWLGGCWAGVITTLLGAAVGGYWHRELAELHQVAGGFPLRAILFVIAGVFWSWLLDLQRQTQASLLDSRAELERERSARREAELAELNLRERFTLELNRREEAERTLRERGERIRMAVESANIGTWDFNPITNQRRWSERCKVMFGLPPDADVADISFLDRLHPEDRPRAEAAVTKALDPDGDGRYEVECRAIWPDGSVHWFIAKGQALFEECDSARRATRFIGTVFEITDRKRAELKLVEAEEKFRAVATHAPVGIFQTDHLGLCLFVNQAWCEIAGGTPEEASGNGWQRFLHPDDRDRLITEWNQITSERRNHFSEFRFINPRKGVRWVAASSSVMLDAHGKINAYVGTVVDVTERKAAEDVVRASEARLQGILDHTPALIYLKDLQGRYTLVNRRWEELCGWENHQVVGRTTDEVFPADKAQQFKSNVAAVVESSKPMTIEETVGLLTFVTVTFPIKDSQGKVVAIGGLSTDITERKQVLEALEAEQDMLRHTIEVQDQERQLVSCEIHDGVVQYATGALMQAESLREQVSAAELAEPLDRIVGVLRKTVAEGRRIINGIRTPVLDDLGVIAAVEQLLADEQRANVRVEFIKDDRLARLSPAIEEALYRITQEALTNVHRHSKSERVRVELGRRGDLVHLEVRDWGIGFTPTSGRQGIHGLKGMDKRARIAGGRCTINSAPGAGTHIIVDLPFQSRK